MTREEVGLSMEVAAKFMGRPPRRVRVVGSDKEVEVWTDNLALLTDGAWDEGELLYHGRCPNYASDPADAHAVLDRLRSRFTNVVIHAANGWGVRCYTVGRDGGHTPGPEGHGETFAVAVCRAALATGDGRG